MGPGEIIIEGKNELRNPQNISRDNQKSDGHQKEKKKGWKEGRKEKKPHRKEEKGDGQMLKRQITEHREVSENVTKENKLSRWSPCSQTES